MDYTRRPKTINALQVTDTDSLVQIATLLITAPADATNLTHLYIQPFGLSLQVNTVDGNYTASTNDWVVLEDGKLRTVADSVFTETYEVSV